MMTDPETEAVARAVEMMGEALYRLSSRLIQVGFNDGDPIKDRNAAAYEGVVKAWEKLTAAIAALRPFRDAELAAKDARIAELEAKLATTSGVAERLITAIEFEVPPIRDGVDVERRLGILSGVAENARAMLAARPGHE